MSIPTRSPLQDTEFVEPMATMSEHQPEGRRPGPEVDIRTALAVVSAALVALLLGVIVVMASSSSGDDETVAADDTSSTVGTDVPPTTSVESQEGDAPTAGNGAPVTERIEATTIAATTPASNSTPTTNPNRAGSTGATSQTTTKNPTPTTAIPTPQAEGPFLEPAELFLAFGEAWTAGDWDRMGTMATDEVVDVARDWQADGGSALLSADNIDLVLEGCFSPATGRTSCEILFAPTSGFGLIFEATYATAGDGLIMVDLVFAGDAG